MAAISQLRLKINKTTGEDILILLSFEHLGLSANNRLQYVLVFYGFFWLLVCLCSRRRASPNLVFLAFDCADCSNRERTNEYLIELSRLARAQRGKTVNQLEVVSPIDWLRVRTGERVSDLVS